MAPSTCPFAGDDSLKFLNDGYEFAGNLRRAHSNADDDRPIRTRLLGQETILLRGVEGVRAFYDTSLVKRAGAMPMPIQGSLFGQGSVHSLDDDEHRHRKETFVRVCYDDAQVERIKPLVESEIREAMHRWAKATESVYDTMVIAYGRAAMRWAGIDARDAELDEQARRLGEVVDGFAHLNLDHVRAWVNRWRTDRWMAQIIRDQRAGRRSAEPGTSLYEWANHRDLDGELLDAQLAGIELQNTIRPHIAVARFAAFATHALFHHPQWRGRIGAESAERGSILDGPLATAFAQEVRRLYPFVPMLPSWARTDFEVQGEQVRQGDRVLIDILNTNNDPQEWDAPGDFEPERFIAVTDHEELEAFVPQGGGEVPTGHRCPGEKIVISSLATTVAALCEPGVEILGEGLDFDWTTMPTRPTSGGLVRQS